MPFSRTFKAFIIGCSQIFSSLVALISVAVISRVLTQQEYAAYRQVLLVYTLTAPILVLGLPKALYFYLPGDVPRARGILLENQLLCLILGSILGIFIAFGGNHFIANQFNNPVLATILLLIIPYSLFMLPSNSVPVTLMARNRPLHIVYYSLLERFFSLTFILIAAFLYSTSLGIFCANVAAAFLMYIIGFILMLRACGQTDSSISARSMRNQLKYSIPLGMASIVGSLNLGLDKLVVSSLVTPEDFAVYINGAMEIPLVPIMISTVSTVMLPDMVTFFKNNKPYEMLDLWKRVISKSSMILLPLMFMLFFLAEEFIVTVYSEKYLDSVLPFRVYLALLLIRTMDTDAVFIATGKNNLVFLRSAVSLAINLFLSVTLVKLIGYVGAALSTVVIAFFWSAPFTILSIRRIAKVRLSVAYPYHQVGRIIAISAIGCVVFFLRPYLHFLPPATLLIVLGGFYGLVTLILMDRFGFLKIGDLISNARSFAQQRVGSQPKHGEV